MRAAVYLKMREEEKRKREEEKRKREEEKEKKRLELEEKERKAQAALKKSNEGPEVAPQFKELVRVCPRLESTLAVQRPAYYVPREAQGIVPGIQTAFHRLLELPRLEGRTLKNWKPQGKSANSLFQSLASHFLAKYPMPPFLWSVFFDEQGPNYTKTVAAVRHLAAGGSMKAFLKSHTYDFPVPLTTKMIHDFIRSPADFTFMKAMRAAQVKNLGGTVRLRDALLGTNWGKYIGSSANEAFWQSAVQWFGQQALLDPTKVQPMCDFIQHQKLQDENYSLKGRTALTVIRGMEQWHHELARTRPDAKYKGQLTYKPSGYKEATFDFSQPDSTPPKKEIWRFREILTAKELFDEGKRQSHCVGSYAWSIEQGRISIWTLTKEDDTGNWAMLTLEVVNQTGQIVQARGRFNRLPTPVENQMMNRWMGVYRG